MVILGFCADARQWNPISWSSRQTILVLKLLPGEVWNSVVLQPRTDILRTMHSHSVSLCGLPLRSWAITAPRRFHFTITALTVDRGSSSRADIWETDLLERWHPMTVPRWKSLSSSVRLFYWQYLCMEIARLCARIFIHLSATGVAEIVESTNLKGLLLCCFVCCCSAYCIFTIMQFTRHRHNKTQ